MVTDTGGINDKSFNQSAWEGMQQAASANPNITVKYLQSTSQSDYVPNINTFIGQKCGIIVTVGFLMAQATQTAAQKNPTANFAIVDNAYTPVIKNVDALVFNTVQDGFLGGYLAEYSSSGASFSLYIRRAFADLQWANFVAPTLKTAVFGFIIGTVSSYFGYTTNMGAAGVGRAATNSVVVSSLMVILADVIVVKCIFGSPQEFVESS